MSPILLCDYVRNSSRKFVLDITFQNSVYFTCEFLHQSEFSRDTYSVVLKAVFSSAIKQYEHHCLIWWKQYFVIKCSLLTLFFQRQNKCIVQKIKVFMLNREIKDQNRKDLFQINFHL